MEETENEEEEEAIWDGGHPWCCTRYSECSTIREGRAPDGMEATPGAARETVSAPPSGVGAQGVDGAEEREARADAPVYDRERQHRGRHCCTQWMHSYHSWPLLGVLRVWLRCLLHSLLITLDERNGTLLFPQEAPLILMRDFG